MRRGVLIRAAVAALLLGIAPNPPRAAEPGFDFYVLALSWSPSYCADADQGSDQCRSGAGRGFILHGLWPQYERGYPESCPTDFPLRVSGSLARAMLDIMPSVGLVGYEWRKHGTCTGLDPARYFAAAREAYERVRVPEALIELSADIQTSARALEAAFVAANPGLAADGIAVACEGGRLAEIRICLTDALAFRNCREVDSGGCRSSRLDVPAPS